MDRATRPSSVVEICIEISNGTYFSDFVDLDILTFTVTEQQTGRFEFTVIDLPVSYQNGYLNPKGGDVLDQEGAKLILRSNYTLKTFICSVQIITPHSFATFTLKLKTTVQLMKVSDTAAATDSAGGKFSAYSGARLF